MGKLVLQFSAFFLCGVLALSGAARADIAINEQGAVDLKKQVEDNIQWRIDMAKAVGQGVAMGGNIEVTPKDKFYEVKLPNLSTVMGPQGKLDIGTVIIHAVPTEKPGEWQTEVIVPSTMTFYDANVPVVYISIGEQHFSGTWMPAMEMYSKFDSLYQKIQIKGADEKIPTANIDSAKASVEMKDNGDGTWSGPFNFDISGVKMDIPAGSATLPNSTPTQMTIAKISSHNTYDRVDMRQALEIKKAFKDAFKAKPNPTEGDIRDLLKNMVPKMPLAPGDMSMNFEIDNFSLHEVKGAAPQPEDPQSPLQPPRELLFDKMSFIGSSTGTQQEKAKVSMKTNLSGLRIPSIPANLAGLMPNTVNAEASIDNLPLKKITEILFKTVQASIAAAPSPEAAQKDKEAAEAAAKEAADAAAAAMPKVLQDAGSFLTVENTYIKSQELDVLLAGKIAADAAAVSGAAGKMTLSIRGMDETIQKLQTEAGKNAADTSLMGFASGLTVVQMLGQPSVAADGKSLRSYAFEITQDGKVLMNGADIKLLAGGFTGSLGKDSIPGMPPSPEATPTPETTPGPAPSPAP